MGSSSNDKDLSAYNFISLNKFDLSRILGVFKGLRKFIVGFSYFSIGGKKIFQKSFTIKLIKKDVNIILSNMTFLESQIHMR